MAKYTVTLTAEAAYTITVEATDRDEAARLAEDGMQGGDLCAQCSGYRQSWELSVGDYEVQSVIEE